MTDYILVYGERFELCPCCGKPKRPKGKLHPGPWCPVRQLGEQSGESSHKRSGQRKGGIWSNEGDGGIIVAPGDTGTAARFFFQAGWSHEIAEQVERAAPVYYQAKASRRERDAGLNGMVLRTKHIYGEGIISADHPETAPGGRQEKGPQPPPHL